MKIAILALVGVSILCGLALVVRSYWKMRGTRLITCPENDPMQRGPGPLTPEGLTTDRRQFAPEKLPGVLSTHKPPCFDCHVVALLGRLGAWIEIAPPERLRAFEVMLEALSAESA